MFPTTETISEQSEMVGVDPLVLFEVERLACDIAN
jgi:hypothetical protein